jgi:hypothetical protein
MCSKSGILQHFTVFPAVKTVYNFASFMEETFKTLQKGLSK